MNLFKKDKNKQLKNEVETIGVNPTLEELEMFFGRKIGDISSSMLNSATYYACMQIRCNALAKLPIKLMQMSSDGNVEKIDDDIAQVLKYRPNPYITPHDFLWSTEYQRLEYGNAYWLISTLRGKIKALYLLDSRNMEIIIDDTSVLNKKNAVYYYYHDSKYGDEVYTSDEIVHFKNFALNGIEGKSIKKYLSDTINSEKMAREVIIPIPTDFKVEQLETKLVNNQFFELQGLTTRQIANAFGVKGFQLNDMEKSTYNNIEQQNRAFYSDTLQNVVTSYEQEMDYKLLTLQQRSSGKYFRFNVDAILRSDILTRYQAHQIGINNGFLKISEAREKENLTFEKGTDRLIIGNGASIPLSELGNQYTKKGGDNSE